MATSLQGAMVFRNGVGARNRVVLAPMTNGQSHADGSLGEDELRWLEMRAEGGFGVITTCAAHVSQDGQAWAGELGIFHDRLIPGLSRLAATMHGHGALVFVQLFHGGLRAEAALTGAQTWSASDAAEVQRAAKGAGGEANGPRVGWRAATEEDLLRVIADFGSAARRAEIAGMDGVEIHGAHGYLLTQFLSTIENQRADRWGGTLENRARLIREVTRAVRRSVKPGFVVGVRLSPEDFGNARGLDLDEMVRVAAWLCEDGVDYVHLSLWEAMRNTVKRPERHALQVFREGGAVPSDVLLWVAGKVWTREEGERLIELGAAGVALGRAGIANPDWARCVGEAGWEPRRPPLRAEELRARGLSEGFVEYMRKWKGFVEG